MTEYSKYNIIYRLQKWLDSVPGQTFLNYAYSWGASVVILGTLFKLTHLPGANIMLYIGMGTEVVVFFISAFDRPFDKTAIGKEIPTHVTDEDFEDEQGVIDENQEALEPALDGESHGQSPSVVIVGGGGASAGEAAEGTSGGIIGSGGIVIGGGGGGQVASGSSSQEGISLGEGTPSTDTTVNGPIAQSPGEWVLHQQQITPEMEEATSNYVEELKKLTEMLSKVAEQSERLTRDSEEMENLNRTLTGICKVYEMQLKGASSQIGTIDQINEQSRKMASQIEQLNKIYTRMIEAMTVNMRTATGSGTPTQVE